VDAYPRHILNSINTSTGLLKKKSIHTVISLLGCQDKTTDMTSRDLDGWLSARSRGRGLGGVRCLCGWG